MNDVIFVTGSPEKAENFSKYIEMNIDHHPVDLDEIQTTDHRELVEHKIRQAYEKLKSPVLVEDVFLTFNAWGKLPGPFVKFFVKQENGPEKMCRMLDGFDDRSAFGSCMFGYYDGNRLEFFEGKVKGNIAQHPRGENGFGFDRILELDMFDGKTASELNDSEYDTYYTAIKPFADVRAFLKNELQ